MHEIITTDCGHQASEGADESTPPCPRCGGHDIKTERVPLSNGGHHIKASCAVCGRFIKFLPHASAVFHFGKHKGKAISEVATADPEYVRWCLSEGVLRGKLRDAAQQAMGMGQ